MVTSIKLAMKRAREVEEDKEEENNPPSPPLSPSHLTEGEAVRRALLEAGEEERRL